MTAKRPRFSREGLRELLVETGGSILREDGLGTGAETVTFKKVFDRVEEETGIRLTNASVIRRVWRNQSEFQADVLVAIALKENSDEIDLNVDAVVPVLSNVDFTSPESARKRCVNSAGWGVPPVCRRSASQQIGHRGSACGGWSIPVIRSRTTRRLRRLWSPG